MKFSLTLLFLLIMNVSMSQPTNVYRVYKVVNKKWIPDQKKYENTPKAVDFDIKLDKDRIYIYDDVTKIYLIHKNKKDYKSDSIVVRHFEGHDENKKLCIIYVGYNQIKNETSVIVFQPNNVVRDDDMWPNDVTITQYFYKKKQIELNKN